MYQLNPLAPEYKQLNHQKDVFALIHPDRLDHTKLIVQQVNEARQLHTSNRFGYKILVHTAWNLSLFSQLLEGYRDKDIIEWLKYGWPLGLVDRTQPSWATKNHPSAILNPQAVDRYIQKELEYRTTIGPFRAPPFDSPVGKSPISTRNKRNTTEKRILMDFSWPRADSINDRLPEKQYMGNPMVYDYPSVDLLAERTARLGKKALLWKSDIKRCFKQIFICPRDIPYQGFMWRGLWYFDTSLIMGCRTAPYITMRCTSAIAFVHRQMGYFTIAYADDFSGAELQDKAVQSYQSFLNLLRDLRIEEATEKSVPPSPIIIFLGTGIDAVSQTIFVIPERIHEIRGELEQWRFKIWCTRNQLESIIGKLQFCTNCVRAGRVFICRLLNQLKKMQRHKFYQTPVEVRLDLKWWWTFLPMFKSSYILWPEIYPLPGQLISTDASKKAVGAVCMHFYLHARFPEWLDPGNRNIAHLEFLSILIACKKWVKILQGKKFRLQSDNMAVVLAINKGRAKDLFLQQCLRELVMLCCLNSVELDVVHIRTELNTIPDLLSRWYHGADYRRKFRRLTVNKGYKRQHVKPEMFSFANQW